MRSIFYKKFYKIKPIYRKFILILNDLVLINFSLILSFWLTSINPESVNFNLFNSFRISILISSIPIYFFSGHYKSLTLYFGSKYLYSLSLRNLILISFNLLLGYFISLEIPPIKISLVLLIILTLFIALSRLLLRDFILFIRKENNNLQNVVIYGAGSDGAQLALSQKILINFNIIFFVDDNESLHGRFLNGIPIYAPSKIKDYSNSISKVLIAIPSISKERCRYIFSLISSFKVPILKLPPLENFTLGNSKIDDLRPLDIEDLLGRDTVLPNDSLLRSGIENHSICITGAGGSIGSELSNQIFDLNPSNIFLIDNSEYNLYQIINKLKSKKFKNTIQIVPLLGTVCDINFLEHIFSTNKIDTIFHAAAYKHVPIVEINPIEGIKNNVISTYNICKIALKYKVKQLIFISTDKAVRPTNVMGASKRLAENIIQAFDERSLLEQKKLKTFRTKFSMVRFGNVLGSSGSVIPLFKQQINEGGPITITDPNITRYFMTIKEAVQLVIQSTNLTKGGDLFLLDMGKPVKIKDLAIEMINLSGFVLKDKNNLRGNIEIKYVGLRPGEKLYEELLIDADANPTKHPLIYRANEKYISLNLLEPYLKDLIIAMRKFNKSEVFKILLKLVPEWQAEK